MTWLHRLFARSGEAPAYCPVCSKPLSYDAKTCPSCSADIEAWNRKNFVEKLIGALKHPLADIRMRAIIVLGKRRAVSAEGPLVECALAHPIDVIEGLAIVESLRKIREASASDAALQTLTTEHPGEAVRRAAKAALARD
jgi:hypothetical protein